MLGRFVLDLVAATYGTPTYVYDLDGMGAEARALRAAFDGAPHLVAYAVKANSAGPVVRALAAEGCGADVVSGGELRVALGAGIAPDRVVFSGVAKTDDEIDQALAAGPEGIGALQIESVEEIARVAARARTLGRRARVSLRINPEVDRARLDTHAGIATGHDDAKFGVPRAALGEALTALAASPSLALVGVGAHVGSQFTTLAPYLEAARTVFDLAREARSAGAALRFVDTGGGFGIDYGGGREATPSEFIRAARTAQLAAGLDDLALYCEPGRALVGAHGVLLARVIQTKRHGARRWLMIDAGMNDLMRPALYQARHRVVSAGATVGGSVPYRVVGPVCESSDDFGVHELADPPPTRVVLLDAGAYGYTMASRYNGRAVPAEVFVRGGCVVAAVTRRPAEEWADERLAVAEAAPSRGAR